MRLQAWPVPPYDNRMYLIADERRHAILIDPSMGEREAIAAVREGGLILEAILNTHGHPDHIHGNAAVKEATRARLAIHRLDAYRLGPSRPPTTFEVPPSDADDLLEEGDLRYVADLRVRTLHLPGHTEGSVCFYLADAGTLFSGDLLFRGSTGRWDLPGGDRDQIERSLDRLMDTVPLDTKVLPGHGEPTTLRAEVPTLQAMHAAGVLPGLRLRPRV